VFEAAGQAMGIFWNGADYVTVEGIEIRNAIFDGVSLFSESIHGQAFSPTIRRCTIHDCGATGVTIYGNSARPQNTLIENNFFYNLQINNGGSFSTTARFGYVSGRRHDFSRVIHNTFYVTNSAGSGFCVIGDLPSGGVGSHYAEVSNNIIVKTTNATRPIYSFPDNPAATSGIPAVLDSNCYYDISGGPFSMGTVAAPDFATWVTASLKDTLSLNTDPMLVSPGTGDLHLSAVSPCIDASLLPTGVLDDIDGDLRGLTADIGADEAVNCVAQEFQVNSVAASLDLDGVQGTLCTPANLVKGQNLPTTLTINSNLLGNGFDAAIVPVALVPASAGAYVTPNGQILNLSLSATPMIFLFGGASLTFSVPFPGTLVLPFSTPSSPLSASIQMVIVNPAHPDFASLSQGAGLIVL
jgi:hypothetical protein